MTPDVLSAQVRYLKPRWKDIWRETAERPKVGSRERRRENTDFYEVEITDARPANAAGELHLDTNGFILLKHRSAVTDFHDSDEVKRVYYPEMCELVRRETGADLVLTLNHLLRTETPKGFADGYARYVHCDFAEESSRGFARRIMSDAGYSAEVSEQYDYAWYNVWQPIDWEVRWNPLTLVDARTLDDGDVVEYIFGEKLSDGVASMPVYNPDHRFYYFPRMQTDELILFKQLDSRPGRSKVCPHTSFDDAGSTEDAPRRRSIELRLLAGFRRDGAAG